MYQQARLYIDDVEIIDFDTVNVTTGGNNTINKLTCVITDPTYADAQILDSDIRFYLNYGCSEETPYFRGIIRNYVPSDKQVQITALDPRVLISGKTSPLISLTDEENYDGHTVSQFIQEIIEEKVNINNKIRIGLNLLNETYPAVRMKGIRGDNKSPYDFAKEALKKADNLDINNELYGEVNQWRMGMIDDGNYNNIIFYKEQSVNNTSNPAVVVSYHDNLQKYTYKIRPVPSVISGTTEDGQTRTYIDGNTPTGILSKQLKDKFKGTDDIIDAALRQISMSSVEIAEVSIDVGKLAYHSLGDIIKLNVPEEELHNLTHRIKNKKVSYSHSKGTTINIGLNKDRTVLSEYLKASD